MKAIDDEGETIGWLSTGSASLDVYTVSLAILSSIFILSWLLVT